MDNDGCIFAAVAAICAGALGFWAGSWSSRTNLQAQAVQHGAAQFVIVDATDGDTEFKWNEAAIPSPQAQEPQQQ